jgi:hypothetical protein
VKSDTHETHLSDIIHTTQRSICIVIKNSATIAGRTMNGKTEGSSPDGDSFTREWKATRK